MTRSLLVSTLVVGSAALCSSCRDAPLADNVPSNLTPIAHAGDMQTFPYAGSPVAVTLDGSRSDDPDGEIVRYHWLSGNRGDGGAGRGGPDPEDVVSPNVLLGEGLWTFVLYVTDNDEGVSEPATVTIRIGAAPGDAGARPDGGSALDASTPSIDSGASLDGGESADSATVDADTP